MPEIDPVIGSMLRYGLAALFISACLHKVVAWRAFIGVLDAYGLCPTWLLPPLCVLLVGLEGAAGATALFVASQRYAMMLICALLGLYSLAIAINLVRGHTSIDCGCSGAGMRHTLSKWLLVRNLILIAAALAALAPNSQRQLHFFDGWIVGAGVGVLALLYIAIDQLLANRSRLGNVNTSHA